LRAERCDVALVRGQARAQRLLLHRGGPADGPARLLYALNPLLPCASPTLAGRWVARLGDLLPALEVVAARPAGLPFDAHIAAFAAARGDERVQEAVLNGRGADEPGAPLALRALAAVQAATRAGPMPGIAAWLATPPGALLAGWRSPSWRAAVGERLGALAPAGRLPDMLAVIEDPAGRAADAGEAEQAAQTSARLRQELEAVTQGAAVRAESARRLGQELAVGGGVAALAVALAMVALG